MIAREGDPAPGVTDQAKFAQINYSEYFEALNAAGQIAFLAELAGTGVTTANNTGLFATDLSGSLRLIAREGSPLEVAPGVSKIVREISVFHRTNNEDGRQSSFNDAGQLAFRAIFTDFTEGIFVSNVASVPEPSAFISMLIAGLIAGSFSPLPRKRR